VKPEDIARLWAEYTKLPDAPLRQWSELGLGEQASFAELCRTIEREAFERQLRWLRTVPGGGYHIYDHDIAPFNADIARENGGARDATAPRSELDELLRTHRNCDETCTAWKRIALALEEQLIQLRKNAAELHSMIARGDGHGSDEETHACTRSKLFDVLEASRVNSEESARLETELERLKSADPAGARELLEEARQHCENIPVNENPTAANAYAAFQAVFGVLEALLAVGNKAKADAPTGESP
jgi:hypothetical protein